MVYLSVVEKQSGNSCQASSKGVEVKAFLASILILMLTACTPSEVLDEHRAKTLIEQDPQTARYPIRLEKELAYAMTHLNDSKLATKNHSLGRLLEMKLVRQKTDGPIYPNVSGS